MVRQALRGLIGPGREPALPDGEPGCTVRIQRPAFEACHWGA